MKEQALSIAAEEKDPRLSLNKLREYLHHVILRELFEQNVLDELVFHGGTALRILYDLRRFSEDLDFHLKEKSLFDLKGIAQKIKKHLDMQGYQLSLKGSSADNVQSVFIKFERILEEAHLTSQGREKMRVKIEVDTNPPQGFRTESSLVHKFLPFGVIHHDKTSFLAGKLHAVLQRSYTKGRDYYDLWFYLSKWKDMLPNLLYLNNALKQTGFKSSALKKENWRQITAERIKETDWDYVANDVKPFLENQNDLKILTKQTLLTLLS